MRAKRTDANHREIKAALQSCGWKIVDLFGVGRGVPDLLACRGEIVRMVEVKRPKGKLTRMQFSLYEEGWPIHILRSVDDAINLR